MRGPRSPYSGTGSPGDGVTIAPLSREPLATEGEATPGPDEYNPYRELAAVEQQADFDAPESKTDLLADEPDLPPLW